MERTRTLTATGIAGAMLTSALGIAGASPAAADYGGCWSGQLGLYMEANGGGSCYGFSGTNRSFANWSPLPDDVRSGKNIGVSGNRARVYPHADGGGGVAFCLAQNQQGNNPHSPQGNSNDWGNACNAYYNHWGEYVK